MVIYAPANLGGRYPFQHGDLRSARQPLAGRYPFQHGDLRWLANLWQVGILQHGDLRSARQPLAGRYPFQHGDLRRLANLWQVDKTIWASIYIFLLLLT